jgi:Protein of unknown function (DUF642)
MLRVPVTGAFLSAVVFFALAVPAQARFRQRFTSNPISPSASQNCPAYPGGTGILVDGDFSQAADSRGFYGFGKGQIFAPLWKVSKSRIEFYSTAGWGGYTPWCSVDLDASPSAGGIKHEKFATTPGAMYSVTFEFSGNNVNCYGSSPKVKTMEVKAAGQSHRFTFDTSGGMGAGHGDWEVESWSFQADSSLTKLAFKSKDVASSNCGPVVGPVSVTQTSR